MRKAHNNGRNHLANVRDYSACALPDFPIHDCTNVALALGHDKAQNIIDQITAAYETGGGPPPGGFGFGPQHLGGPPPPGMGPPMGFGPPPGYGARTWTLLTIIVRPLTHLPARPPFAPPFPPNGAPGVAPPFPPNLPPAAAFPGGQLPFDFAYESPF